jgi:methylthioribose-1-phosphate isomerase
VSATAAPGPPSRTEDRRAAQRPAAVNKRLTADRTRAAVENPEYAAFVRRILTAYARRVATGDIEALALMAELAGTIDTSIRDAVTGLRDNGYSWADIGSRLGVTRQAAQQLWGNRP